MDRIFITNFKINRKAILITSLMDDSDEKSYWPAKTPQERLAQIEILRRINYGNKSAARLQRVFEITERERR